MIRVPELDDIAFDALVDEGRALIARHAPDWTDHNLHDPGITLLDLLAWLIDQQVYRIGFVGDGHLRAFAALLGVQPQPARPAHGLLWPAPKLPIADLEVPAGTRAWPEHQPDLLFTTPAPVRLTAASIEKMAATRPGASLVKPNGGGDIRLDPGIRSLELALDRPLFDDEAATGTVALGLEFAGPMADARPAIAYDYQAGDGSWHRAEASWIGGSAGRSGVALLAIGHGGVAALRLDFAGFAVPALPTRVALNVLPLVQIETLAAIDLGGSQGLPDLELPLGGGALPAPKTVRHPLVVTIVPGGAAEWKRVPDLAGSGPGDRHYLLDEARGTIRFGNGVNGLIPPAGSQVRRQALDVTAGAAGNLAAGADWGIQRVPSGPLAWANREPIAGGCDAWDRETLLTELRLRSQKRLTMLTDAELGDAATRLQGYGVERAEVLARFMPTLPQRSVPGARTLLLHPAEGVSGSDAWVDAVERRLAPRRVLGERLSLAAAEPVRIAVSAELLIASGTDAPAIRKGVEAVLQARLRASGKAQPIEPWPSGRPVTSGELEALVAGVDGVVAVRGLRVGGRGEPAEQTSVPLERTEVAVAGDIALSLTVEG